MPVLLRERAGANAGGSEILQTKAKEQKKPGGNPSVKFFFRLSTVGRESKRSLGPLTLSPFNSLSRCLILPSIQEQRFSFSGRKED